MIRISQLVAVAAITLIGAGGGLLLTRTMGGRAATDVCRGVGTLEGTTVAAVTPSAVNSFATTDTFYTCHKLGFRVIFNARTGEVVSQVPLDQEVVEYYKTHPAENPLTIANKTADAEFAKNAFTTAVVPTPVPGPGCFPGSTRIAYPRIGVSLCLPDGWLLTMENDGGFDVQPPDRLVIVGAYPKARTGTLGATCASPTAVTLPTGVLRVCALNVDPLGGQGHGLVWPSGREGGASVYRGASESERDLAFQVAYSLLELP